MTQEHRVDGFEDEVLDELLAGEPRWRDGYEAAARAAHPDVGPGVDGREARTAQERARNATRAFDPPYVVAWDEHLAFDLEGFVDEDRSIRPADAQVAHIVADGLSGGELVALDNLRWAADDTIRRMRDLLVTPTHSEGRVTAFLTTWAFEQYWLGRTLTAVLEAAGATIDREPPEPWQNLRLRIDSHARSIGVAVRTNLVGEDVVTLHVARGLLDARVLAAAARALAARAAGRTAIAELTGRIAARQDVYAQFHREQVVHRLAQSGGARRLLRVWSAARRWGWPGARYAPRDRVLRALAHLLGGPAGRAEVRRIDREFLALAAPRSSRGPVEAYLRRFGFGTSHR